MTLTQRIETACATTKPRTPARRKALSQIKWRLRFGLLYAGTKPGAVLCVAAAVPEDEALVFDGRDNEEYKRNYYSKVLGMPFEIELLEP